MVLQQLALRRVRFSKEADSWLKVMKSRTGITPNLLCRLAVCLSLNEQGVPNPAKYPEDSDREINRYTLLGEFDAAFVALLRQRFVQDKVGEEMELDAYFRAHLHRGIMVLATRLKGLSDLADLVTNSGKAPGPRARGSKGARGRGKRAVS
jgi:DNA sulfur modification protein DndE